MCMAIPMKLLTVEGLQGMCDVNGVRRAVRLDLIEDPAPGQYLLVHAGFAIEAVSEAEARKTFDLMADIAAADDDGADLESDGPVHG